MNDIPVFAGSPAREIGRATAIDDGRSVRIHLNEGEGNYMKMGRILAGDYYADDEEHKERWAQSLALALRGAQGTARTPGHCLDCPSPAATTTAISAVLCQGAMMFQARVTHRSLTGAHSGQGLYWCPCLLP